MIEANFVRTELGGGDVELSDPSKLAAEPLVSVWMTTYDHAAYIQEALDSVLMQQVDFPYEICLGEDGSTDGTREICLRYLEKYPEKLRLFLRDRSNPARAQYKFPFRYNGVETWNACRGKYVAILEGDDYWISQRKLACQVEFLESHPKVSICAHNVIRLPEGMQWRADIYPGACAGQFTIEQFLRDPFYAHTSSFMLRHGRGTMKWDAFCQAPCGDVPVMFCHLLQGAFAMCPEIMSAYRLNDGGVWASQSLLVKSRQVNAMWELLRPLVPSEFVQAYQIGRIRLRIALIRDLRKHGEINEVVRCLRETLSMIADLLGVPWTQRCSLTYAALEGILVPGLHRLREGLMRRWQKRQGVTPSNVAPYVGKKTLANCRSLPVA
jgi:glycosyltransferase involved in cell wall biosynthesis